MLGYNIATAICLGLMAAMLVYVGVSLLTKNRTERIAFVRGFKHGKGFLAYVISVPLYMIGYVYAGNEYLISFFSSVNKAINTVVLKYDVAVILKLMGDNLFYKVTVYVCFVLIALNFFMLSMSLFGQQIWARAQLFKFKRAKQERLLIIGSNSASANVYAGDKTRAKLLLDANIAKEVCNRYYADKLAYRSLSDGIKLAKYAIELVAGKGARRIVVINTEDDGRNLSIAREFYDYLSALPEAERQETYDALQIYVFGNSQYDDLYAELAEHSAGVIRYVDKYRQIAMDFVDRFPLTRFMDGRHIDYDTSLVRRGVELNVLLVGFGDTNQQIFLTSVANNQFLTENKGEIVPKQVHYHVFDKEKTPCTKNLNHSYYRYRNEVLRRIYPQEGEPIDEKDRLCADDYLPLPAEPADDRYYPMDVSSPDFYRTVRTIVTRNPNDVNYMVIAFGSDLVNLDMAQKLTEKRREWGVENMVVFVKAQNWCKEYDFLQQENCYLIADEDEIVYNLDHILNDALCRMAKLRNEIYDIEYQIKDKSLTTIGDALAREIHRKCERAWYDKTQTDRDSNLYCSLSLRSKLNLMGLDYIPADSKVPALSEKEYLSVYAAGDLPHFDQKLTTLGKHIVEYTLDFPSSRRRTMAIQEHYRWNSYMISVGTIPATIKQIREERDATGALTKGKNAALRRHGNLTTYDGLLTFRRLVAEVKGVPEIKTDVIKYDYQLLDDAYWFLTQCGYQIIRRD